MNLQSVALGFRVHTGWAAMVAVSGALPHVKVWRRSRVELLDSNIPRFVYHEASELDFTAAAVLVRRAEDATRAAAMRALQEIVAELRSAGASVEAAAVPVGSTAPPNDLRAILQSHALIHAAEGRLFRQALIRASETCGLRLVTARERDIWKKVGAAARRQIGALGRTLGPPWTEDQKLAVAAALSALQPGVGS